MAVMDFFFMVLTMAVCVHQSLTLTYVCYPNGTLVVKNPHDRFNVADVESNTCTSSWTSNFSSLILDSCAMDVSHSVLFRKAHPQGLITANNSSPLYVLRCNKIPLEGVIHTVEATLDVRVEPGMSTQRTVLEGGAEIVTLLGVDGTADVLVEKQASVVWTMVAQPGYVARADVCSVSREGDVDIVLQNGCSNEDGRMSDFQYTGMENGGRKYALLLVPDAFDSGNPEVSIMCSVRQCPLADAGDCDVECDGNTRRRRRNAYGVKTYVATLKLRFNKSQADGRIMTQGTTPANVETVDFLSAGTPVCRVSVSALWILSSFYMTCKV